MKRYSPSISVDILTDGLNGQLSIKMQESDSGEYVLSEIADREIKHLHDKIKILTKFIEIQKNTDI